MISQSVQTTEPARSRTAATPVIAAAPTPIHWHPGMSVYASEGFLKAVGEEYGWIAGTDRAGEVRCILPYTVVRKSMVRMVRFRVETIPVGRGLSIEEEKSFLNRALECFRAMGAAAVIPAATNTLFRTYPDGAVAAPYASHIIDLTPPEAALWNNLHSKHRNVIRNARNKGVQVVSGSQYAEAAFELIRDTFKRSAMGFMGADSFRQMVQGLGENVKIFVATLQNEIQGCAVIPFSGHTAYYAYGGSVPHPLTGATNLLQWEAIRSFSALGVKRYDFCGGRIDPEKGSKQAGLMMYKERFGGQLSRGYMWKCSLRPFRASLYALGVRLLRGGDIVDNERHKLPGFQPFQPYPLLSA